jgi:hypothetical protein
VIVKKKQNNENHLLLSMKMPVTVSPDPAAEVTTRRPQNWPGNVP